MPTLTFSIGPDGLVVDVMIGLNATDCHNLQQSGRPIPRPIRVRGVMDSASDITAVAAHVLRTLGITSPRSTQTHTASGLVKVDVYEISLSILHPAGAAQMFADPHLEVTELLHAAPGIDVLVGLNVILQGILTIDGPASIFTFTF